MHLGEVLVQGLTFGSLYALVAMSFNVMFRPTNVFNFAQGELLMIGAMLTAVFAAGFGMTWLPAAVVVMLIIGSIAVVEERIAVRPVLRRSSHTAGWVITTLAVSLILADLAGKIWDDNPRPVRPPAFLPLSPVEILGLRISPYQAALIVFTFVVAYGLHLLYRTRFGLAVRAVAEDRDAALLQGINPVSVSRASFLLGGALAGLAGAIAAPLVIATIAIGFPLLIKGFATVAVGGIGDNRGALLAGLTLGVIEAAGAAAFSPGLQTTVLFTAMLLILMVRPHGLFGSGAARHV